jgi:hypothetical protein
MKNKEISLEQAAKERCEVYFYLGEDNAVDATLDTQVGYYYSTVIYLDDSVSRKPPFYWHYQYPYALVNGKWHMVGTVDLDFGKTRFFRSIEACKAYHSAD